MNARSSLLFILMLSTMLFSPVLSCLPCGAAGESLSDKVISVERQLGIIPDNRASLPARVAAAERRVFGFPQNGPLMARLDKLKQTLAPSTAAPSAAMPEPSGNIEDSLPSLGSTSALSDNMPLLNAIPPNFLRIEPPGAPVDLHADYFPTVLASSNGKVLHFKQMPIPVYINPFPDRNFITCVVRGFEAWEDRTGGAVRFVQLDEPAKARIQVVWKRLGAAEDNSGCMLGAHTITRFSPNSRGGAFTIGGVPLLPKIGGSKYTVPPQVIEVNLDLIMSKAPNIRYRLLQNVVTHELGHALGLLGHSKNVDDMMYSITDEHSRLSQRDINTLIKLYERKPDVAL